MQIAFGRNVRMARQRRQFSQQQLGELAGISTQYVSRIERGWQSASLEVIVKLSRALKVPPGKLFQGIH
jgi:transcriptional regulator with XRE-family HTH domain